MSWDRRVVLIDIDHTLSNAFHRDPMIGTTSWDEYHAASTNDEPLHDMINLVNALHDAGFNIICITARPDKWRGLTMKTLARFGAKVDDILMRHDENFRPSPEMKLQLAIERFGENLKDKIAFVIEDRTDVCTAFRDLGVTVLQVHGRKE